MTVRAIGGVMPAVVPRPVEDNLWRHWTTGYKGIEAYSSARSALAGVGRCGSRQRLWLPAYICQSLYDGALASGREVAWYSVDGALTPQLAEFAPGDMVVLVDYFGRPPNPEVRAFVMSRPDIVWIEDRAQALDPNVPKFTSNAIYSPRKLFGVGDGGLLVTGWETPMLERPAEDEAFLWEANDLRARDPEGLDPSGWRGAYIAREAAFEPDERAMSNRTFLALNGLDWRPEAAARRANWGLLAKDLADRALWADPEVAFAPLAYPILVDDAGAMAAHLAEHRIWAPRHWADLPSPASFTQARDLSRRCLSLPLDGRYGAEDMARIVAAVRSYPR